MVICSCLLRNKFLKKQTVFGDNNKHPKNFNILVKQFYYRISQPEHSPLVSLFRESLDVAN